MFNEWDNPEAIQNIINKSDSKADVLERMGYNRNNGSKMQLLRTAVKLFKLDTSSLDDWMTKSKKPRRTNAFNDWDNPEAIQEILSRSNSRRDALTKMGYSKNNGQKYKMIREAITRFDLDVSSFLINKSRYDNLEEIVKKSISYSEVMRNLGLKDSGGNFDTLKRHIRERKIDISHFDNKKKFNNKTKRKYQSMPLEEIFCENSSAVKSSLRKAIKENSLLEYKCSECGIDDWNDKPLTLQVDHINGINNDHRIENLRYLCPNCHTQTETWGSGNKR